MVVRQDFLETRQPVGPAPAADLTETNRLLKAVLAELRKSIAKIACVVYVQEGIISGSQMGVQGNTSHVKCTFLNEANPVKSIYTIVTCNSSQGCSVAINEPIVLGGTGTGNGIAIAAGGTLILPHVEIQSLYISTADATFTPVNSVPFGSHGNITVYGWTLPEYANITE